MPSLDAWKQKWLALPIPSSTNGVNGFFKGHMHFFAGSGALKLLANCLRHGTEFDGNGNATTMLSGLIAGKTAEVGTVNTDGAIDARRNRKALHSSRLSGQVV